MCTWLFTDCPLSRRNCFSKTTIKLITDIVLELKVEMVNIKIEINKIMKQLFVTHLSLINEIRYSEKCNLSISTQLQHKYLFQNLKTKNPFHLHNLEI